MTTGGTVEVGSELEAEVVRVAERGLYVKLPGGLEGLVHVSQIADEFVKNPSDYAEVGNKFQVKVTRYRNGMIELSARAVESLKKRAGVATDTRTADEEFDEKLKKTMIAADRTQADLRRNREARRSGKKVSRHRR